MLAALLAVFAPFASTVASVSDDPAASCKRMLGQAKAEADHDPQQAAAWYLQAADDALHLSDGSAGSREGQDVYNQACAELPPLLGKRFALLGKSTVQRFTAPGVPTYEVALSARPTGHEPPWWQAAYFDRLIPGQAVKPRYVRGIAARPGWGGSVVAVHEPQAGEDDPFMPPLGYAIPVTVTLDFAAGTGVGERKVILSLHDPTAEEQVSLAQARRPLSGDFGAAMNYPQGNRSPVMEATRGLFRIDRFHLQGHLYLTQPYRPDRVPVVFVHGLFSTPLAFGKNVAGLQADPFVSHRYQFAAYFYPTGGPVLLAAHELRGELQKFKARFHPPHGYVLIGHSLGGLLCRLQVTEPHRAFWDVTMGRYADFLYQRVPRDNTIRQLLIWHRDRAVRRVVFLCTPHHGSPNALGFWPRFGARTIAVPRILEQDGAKIAVLVPNGMEAMRRLDHSLKDKPTIIGGLSPQAPFFRVLDRLPVRAPFHSIIGDRGLGDTPHSSDGTVPYWSSHLPGARSERILPISHSTYDQPVGTAELDRILRADAYQ